jgi:nitrate/TMAO reductase-like tetraheme cytochrome c subunit
MKRALLIFVILALAPAASFAQTVCMDCHDSEGMRPEYRPIPGQWRASWHAQNDVSCHDCHGGDPRDAALAMSPQRGFLGVPKARQVPEFCGKCHIGILKHYLESGHGRALKASGAGPNCVTCHGAHEVQKARIDIINEKRCSQCHSYERAKVMKQSLFATEKKIRDIDEDLKKLKRQGMYTDEEDKALFRTEAEFRTLFHTVDVSLVEKKTDGFAGQLNEIGKRTRNLFAELDSRKPFRLPHNAFPRHGRGFVPALKGVPEVAA